MPTKKITPTEHRHAVIVIENFIRLAHKNTRLLAISDLKVKRIYNALKTVFKYEE